MVIKLVLNSIYKLIFGGSGYEFQLGSHTRDRLIQTNIKLRATPTPINLATLILTFLLEPSSSNLKTYPHQSISRHGSAVVGVKKCLVVLLSSTTRQIGQLRLNLSRS